MNVTLTRTQLAHRKTAIRALQSDHQRQKAKQSAEDFIAWLWVAFIVLLVVGSALNSVGAW